MAGPVSLFGIHEQALQVQRRRLELIASNIANADTPGFQARDVDFRAVLAQVRNNAQAAAGSPGALNAPAVFRVPLQPALDGNTVDTQIEQAQFAEASLRYQASLSFVDGRVRTMLTAISGQ